ncbi:hypothetical protein, partial [Sulfitobacter donghicola]|uniref:hypothetical protein n=1 Tax=Sulfitobacter donghicola TaxID=421000 RepID=UPI001B80961C
RKISAPIERAKENRRFAGSRTPAGRSGASGRDTAWVMKALHIYTHYLREIAGCFFLHNEA